MIRAKFSLMMMIISGILFCVMKLIFRFALTNSLLVNGLIQILLRDEEWLTGILIGISLNIFFGKQKLKNSTEWIKSAEITTKRYKLTFCFDIETCVVFDIGKIVN